MGGLDAAHAPQDSPQGLLHEKAPLVLWTADSRVRGLKLWYAQGHRLPLQILLQLKRDKPPLEDFVQPASF